MTDQLTDAELIEAVAIEVMGWHKDFLGENGEYWFATVAPFRYKQESVEDFDPLTNANHWMLLTEKLKDLGWFFKLYRYPSTSNFTCLVIDDTDRNRGSYQKSCDSPGIAVCLAALEAVRSLKP